LAQTGDLSGIPEECVIKLPPGERGEADLHG
jgi:hypothetical protein